MIGTHKYYGYILLGLLKGKNIFTMNALKNIAIN